MKILIVSDTHDYNSKLFDVIDMEKPFDMFVHCGDIGSVVNELQYKLDCPMHIVAGNNDYNRDLARYEVFNIGNQKVFLTHGHRNRVYYDLTQLYYCALENEANIVMFGHTHVPVVTYEGGVTMVNPGSLTYPRQEGRRPSYIIMKTDNHGNNTFEIKYIK